MAATTKVNRDMMQSACQDCFICDIVSETPGMQKIKFLKLLGLTSHFKRKKIEFDMYLKRRKVLLDDSAVPPLIPEPNAEKSLLPPLIQSSPNTEILAEKLRSETTPEKLEFLLNLGLTPITLVKKEEKERIRRIVEEEKMRRHYRLLAKVNRRASPRRLFVPKSEAAQKLDHIRKMKERNSVPNGMFPIKTHDEDEQMRDLNVSVSSQVYAPKNEQVPYCVSSESSESLILSSVSTSKENTDFSNSSLHNKSFNKFSFKRGHSLKSEWRHSTPKQIFKNNHILMTTNQAGTFEHVSNGTGVSCTSVSTQVDSSLLCKDKSLASLKNSFNWPGLEAIMEAFYRHQNEQSSEKTILSERCQLLRKTQEELKREADSLSKQMSDLLRGKRELDEEKQKHQRAIDHIKQCLQFGR